MTGKRLAFVGALLALIFGNRTRDEIFRLAKIVWTGTNRWGSLRIGYFWIWALANFIAAALNWGTWTRFILAAIPFILLLVLGSLWPVAIGLLYEARKENEHVRDALVAIAHTVGTAEAVIYWMWILPTHNNPRVAFAAAFLIVVANLLTAGGPPIWYPRFRKISSIFIAVTAVVAVGMLFLGTEEEAKAKMKGFLDEGKTFIQEKTSPAPGTAEHPIALACELGYLEVPLGTTYYLVPASVEKSGGCATKIIRRPFKASDHFFADPKDELLVEIFFSDNRTPPLVEFNPTRRVWFDQHYDNDPRREKDLVTGFRFTNQKSIPVLVAVNAG